mgnify:CR=1 FL=1
MNDLNAVLAILGKKHLWEGGGNLAGTWILNYIPNAEQVIILKEVTLYHPSTGYLGVYVGDSSAAWLPARKIIQIDASGVYTFDNLWIVVKYGEMVRIQYNVSTDQQHYINTEYFVLTRTEFDKIYNKLAEVLGLR